MCLQHFVYEYEKMEENEVIGYSLYTRYCFASAATMVMECFWSIDDAQQTNKQRRMLTTAHSILHKLFYQKTQ